MKIKEFVKVPQEGTVPAIEVVCTVPIIELMTLLVAAYGNPTCFVQITSMFGMNADAITAIENFIEENRYNESIDLKQLSSSGPAEKIVSSAQIFKIFKAFAEGSRKMQGLIKGE